MVPWGTLATAAVGIAGIGGTLWQGRRAERAEARNLDRSISAERDRIRVAEKRRTYARHLAACTELARAQINRNAMHDQPPTPQLARQILSEYMAAGTAAMTTTAEVMLIAPEEVAVLADRARAVLPRFRPSADPSSGDYTDVLERLIGAMRADLGEHVPEDDPRQPPAPASSSSPE